MSAVLDGRARGAEPSGLQWPLAIACAVLLGIKFWLISRQNINWDEFFFLNQVHAASRGELSHGLQNSHAHLFGWLTRIDGDEVAQILTARTMMVLLLGLSALLIQRLAMRWYSSTAAWTAALAFLAMWPTMKHGGSFRADSLLLPLHLGALVVLTRPGISDCRRGIGAGLLLGIATVVSVKTILLAPVVGALGISDSGDWRQGARRLAWLAAAAVASAGTLLTAHLLSIRGQNALGGTGTIAQLAAEKVFRNLPWFPQRATIRQMLGEDPAVWLFAAVGAGLALRRRLWPVAACLLALLPIVFYRNSFAYYYVVMWAPACVTIAAVASGVRELASRVSHPAIAGAATLALGFLFFGQGLRDLPYLAHQRQGAQRQLVSAVHAIFPSPVTYIDHSGMIASFRKVNFFMSSWGVEAYVARGRPFMPGAMTRFRPPLLISNRAELMPGTGNYNNLLQLDREIIETYYQPYWGPIRIAGAAAIMGGPEPALLKLPFAGRYRLDSRQPVRIDGTLLMPGEVLTVNDARLVLEVTAQEGSGPGEPASVRLLWADARLPPPELPVSMNYYDAL